MKLAFNFETVEVTEFGVGRDEAGKQTFRLVPVDEDVQDALGEMAAATWDAMQELTDAPPAYAKAKSGKALARGAISSRRHLGVFSEYV